MIVPIWLLGVVGWTATAGGEMALFQQYASGERLTARRLAEERLRDDPTSSEAHLVLGLVEAEEEGNLPRALKHLETALELQPTEGPLHRTILLVLSDVSGSAEREEDQLELLARHNRKYEPRLWAEQAWPLMKLGRIDEARAVALEALQSDAVSQRQTAFNARCAIEGLHGTRDQAWEACKAEFDHAREHGRSLVVPASNASQGARMALRFEDAVELARVSAQQGRGVSTASGWESVAALSMVRGQSREAAQAVIETQAWRASLPPVPRQQTRARVDALIARLFLLVGEQQRGLALVDRALKQPDRRATISVSAEQTQAGDALLRLALSRTLREHRAEEASLHGAWTRWSWWARELWPSVADWEARRRVAAAAADPDMLRDAVAFYRHGGLQAPSWLIGDLVDVLGPGVVEAAVESAARREVDGRMRGYQQALLADVALARRQWRRAFLAGDRALAYLPREEAVLRARAAAVAAEGAWRRGERSTSVAYHQRAWQLDPGVFRRLGLALPAQIEAEGPGTEHVAAMLGRSPRFFRGQGLTLHASRQGALHRICLFGADGSRLHCTEEAGEGDDPRQRARQAVRRFHREAFALPSGLDERELRALEATDHAASQARERLEEALER